MKNSFRKQQKGVFAVSLIVFLAPQRKSVSLIYNWEWKSLVLVQGSTSGVNCFFGPTKEKSILNFTHNCIVICHLRNFQMDGPSSYANPVFCVLVYALILQFYSILFPSSEQVSWDERGLEFGIGGRLKSNGRWGFQAENGWRLEKWLVCGDGMICVWQNVWGRLWNGSYAMHET